MGIILAEIKDSGVREQYASGMVRDTSTDKIDYSLVLDGPMFERWAAHLTAGAKKYTRTFPLNLKTLGDLVAVCECDKPIVIQGGPRLVTLTGNHSLSDFVVHATKSSYDNRILGLQNGNVKIVGSGLIATVLENEMLTCSTIHLEDIVRNIWLALDCLLRTNQPIVTSVAVNQAPEVWPSITITARALREDSSANNATSLLVTLMTVSNYLGGHSPTCATRHYKIEGNQLMIPGQRNWLKASGEAELQRFRESALRHFIQWFRGDTDEDHASSIFFNVNGACYVSDKLKENPIVSQ